MGLNIKYSIIGAFVSIICQGLPHPPPLPPSHVTHLYAAGDVCDITGKPRLCYVKFK